jgi:hypothetical protein
MMVMNFRKSETGHFDTALKKLVSTDHGSASEVAATNAQKVARLNAIVVDPDEPRRVFAATALTVFEPGFDVVTVVSVHEAAEWMESFVPDLLVVSETIEQPDATNLMDAVMKSPVGRRCRVISVGHVVNGKAAITPWSHVALNEGAGLSEWLAAVHYVFNSED